MFSNIPKHPILIDCSGKINPEIANEYGLIFRGIGRGDLQLH